jgi:hypothetical protein
VESILGADNCTDSAFNEMLLEFGDPVRDWAGVSFGGLGPPGDMVDSSGYVHISDAKREVRYWQGSSGIAGVYFIDGCVGGKRWLGKPSIVDRIKRQWHRWFPE